MAITFGSWLKQRRKELGIAQQELADHIGCSEVMLRKLEFGRAAPVRPNRPAPCAIPRHPRGRARGIRRFCPHRAIDYLF